MKVFKTSIFAILISLSFIACSKGDDQSPTEVLSDAKQITSFVFNSQDNVALEVNITASINEATKTILAEVPYGTNISSLIATVTASENAIVTPDGAQNFSSPLSYTVTAQDGSVTSYNVEVRITPNTEGSILSFNFLALTNNISTDITGIIDESEKTITLNLPLEANITMLTPNIEISPDATVDLNGEQDFTSPITYTVTAQNGNQTQYLVEAFYSQYEILATIFNSNPDNTLNWDLSDTNIKNWDGVVMVNNRVTQLQIDSKNISVLPPEIQYLNKITDLVLFSNKITEIPEEIAQLSNLTGLFLSSNNIIELPVEIGQLSKLTSLRLANNTIADIPVQLGNLTNLTNLWLQNNSISEIPEQLGQLIKLTELKLENNNLTNIPQAVCDLETQHNTSITLDAGVTCE